MRSYSAADKILHRLALSSRRILEMSFARDCASVEVDVEAVKHSPHIFVSGLARSGTTALMRAIHTDPEYISLTYRQMPFVLAPNWWRGITGASQDSSPLQERAHGDGIEVNLDSPESLDEVFWRMRSGPDYITPDSLKAHMPGDRDFELYATYIGLILNMADEPGRLYLSKNNNHILRLGGLRDFFPKAHIIIPFRNPLRHAASLLTQHRKFCERHRTDKFAAAYMRWLVHHEFGSDHRRFLFPTDESLSFNVPPDSDDINYWLYQWIKAYSWLETQNDSRNIFMCYEDLCGAPEKWERLKDRLGLAGSSGEAHPFRRGSSAPDQDVDVDQQLAAHAADLYDRLRKLGARL